MNSPAPIGTPRRVHGTRSSANASWVVVAEFGTDLESGLLRRRDGEVRKLAGKVVSHPDAGPLVHLLELPDFRDWAACFA